MSDHFLCAQSEYDNQNAKLVLVSFIIGYKYCVHDEMHANAN